MVLLGSTFVVATAMVVAMAKGQIIFPTSRPSDINRNNQNECTASNGKGGTCYEYRSENHKKCSFFPSVDTSNPDVAKHLRANICKNTGREVFFCCPFGTATQAPTTIPDVTSVSGNTATVSSITNLPPDMFPSEDECGKSERDNIVGGEVTAPGDWPWLAAIGRKLDGGFVPFCGGTLITKQHVISAAHCFKTRFSRTVVRLGEYDVNTVNAIDGAQDFNIVDERFARYNEHTKENDLILLKLHRTVEFSGSIRPACMPYHLRNNNFENDKLIVVGWGIYDNNNRQTSAVPLQALVPVVPVRECQERYKNSGNTVDERQICAGTGGIDSCGGDSGGPINYIDINRGRFYLVGLVSFGPTICGSENLPGVYARIGHYLDWIEDSLSELL